MVVGLLSPALSSRGGEGNGTGTSEYQVALKRQAVAPRDGKDHDSVAPVRSIRKGAAEAMQTYIDQLGGHFPQAVHQSVEEISRSGGTPLVVAEGCDVLGVVQLKDMVKGGIK